MLIEIQCPNRSEFDPATGISSVCGQRMMVDANQIGQLVICPKCKEQVEVVASKYDKQQRPVEQPPAEAKSKKRSTVSTAGKQKSKVSASADGGRRAAAGKAPRRRKTDAPVKKDVMDVAFSPDQVEATFSGDHGPKCKKCGNPAPYGRCSSCRFVEPRFAKMHQPLDEMKMQLSGMQLWFCKTLAEGISIGTLQLIAHLAVGLVAFFMGLLAVLQFVNGNSVSGTIVIVIAMMVVGFYIASVIKAYQFVSNPRAKLGWYQKPFWNLVLWMARAGKWENYDSRLQDRRVIKIRDKGFTDNQLAKLEGIRNVQVLDLENTQVTDQVVALLYRLEHLQCVVLRRTNVTHDAVVRLQQTFPKLWVWY
ncbi:MAG: hypothetical protein AAFN77_19735 [Planctomycetota bacterium]